MQMEEEDDRCAVLCWAGCVGGGVCEAEASPLTNY